MKYPQYPVVESDNPYIYMFFSEGQKGKIRKGVSYTRIGENLFNLGFGDLTDDLQDLNDLNRSNNGDRDVVLATVAYTALIFTDKFPGAKIFIEGSTSARTRLYQMGIAANLLQINEIFFIKGFVNGYWEAFRPGKNYEAFLFTRK